jgi:hypothetical protein
MDYVQIDLAVDPWYEPASFTKVSPFNGSTSNYVSDLIGAVNNEAPSDANKFVITNDVSNPLDVYFSFTNVDPYTGANTIAIYPEMCVSNTALTFDIYIRNFNSSTWESFVGSTTTGTACSTDTSYIFAKNNITMSDYISNGEIRIRFATATSNAHTMQFDRLYMFLGSTNADSSLCEISWGTGTATDCTNTRDVKDDITSATDNTNTFQLTSTMEYPSTFYGADNDDDANNGEVAVAANISFPVTVSSNMAVTAIHGATRAKSSSSTYALRMQAKDYAGVVGTTGWVDLVNGDSGTTTYDVEDTWTRDELRNAPVNALDTVNNRTNLRLKTNSSTDTSTGDVSDWDFAMMSIRFIEVTADEEEEPAGLETLMRHGNYWSNNVEQSFTF